MPKSLLDRHDEVEVPYLIVRQTRVLQHFKLRLSLQNQLVIVLIAVAVASHLPFLMSGPFFSDEAIYTYAGYAILRGTVPYAGITLPQPPLGYLLLAGEVGITNASLLLVREINFLIYLVGVIFVFRVLERISGRPITSFAGTLIFILFPPMLSYSFSAPLEFTYFVTLVFAALYFGLSDRRLCLFGSGIFSGLAIMVWYPGLLVLFALLGYLMTSRFVENVPWSKVLKKVGFVLSGLTVVLLGTLGVIALYWKAYPQFLSQSLGLQTSVRAGFSIAEKSYFITAYLQVFSPLVFLGSIGGLLAVLNAAYKRHLEELFLVFWFVIIFTLLVIVPKVLFPHYFWFLTPVLAYLAARPVVELTSALRRRLSIVKLIALLLLPVAVSVLVYSGASNYSTGPFSNSSFTADEQYVGHYVASITTVNQLIWTSEPSIAFYANRLIIPPNSTLWKLQGFFDDVFNTTFTDTAGFQHQGSNLVSPIQFEQSWDTKVRVLIFIRGSGPIPYPDAVLWNGTSAMPGVSGWVASHYSRVALLTFGGNPYAYEVWERS